MKRKILIIILLLLFVSAGHYRAAAQQTGTRIKDADTSFPGNVIWFNQPREIETIRSLVQEGEKELAVKKARAYVAKLENVGGFEAQQHRYYGLNALCVA